MSEGNSSGRLVEVSVQLLCRPGVSTYSMGAPTPQFTWGCERQFLGRTNSTQLSVDAVWPAEVASDLQRPPTDPEHWTTGAVPNKNANPVHMLPEMLSFVACCSFARILFHPNSLPHVPHNSTSHSTSFFLNEMITPGLVCIFFLGAAVHCSHGLQSS